MNDEVWSLKLEINMLHRRVRDLEAACHHLLEAERTRRDAVAKTAVDAGFAAVMKGNSK
jgi:hypothetical protein